MWNVGGWSSSSETDRYRSRLQYIGPNFYGLIGIAETHLVGTAILSITGYKWYGHNSKTLHKRAVRGSGGVGFLVKIHIASENNVSIIDNSYEDILWLQISNKCNVIFSLFYGQQCALYRLITRPELSTPEFFDTILTQLYQYQHECKYYICGDLYPEWTQVYEKLFYKSGQYGIVSGGLLFGAMG